MSPERLAAEEGLRLRADLAEILNAIDNLVHSTLDFDDIMQRALEEGVKALRADAGTVEMREAALLGRELPDGCRACATETVRSFTSR